MFEEMKDVFELAATATSFVNELLKIKTTKNKSKQNDNGNYSKLASSGYYSQLASSGYYSQLASSGNYSQLASSGDYSKLEITGKTSVAAAIGYKNIVKAVKGTWVTLAEYDNEGKVQFVKTEQIDGERLKENCFYTLYNKEFQEVEEIDGIKTIILKRKQNVIHGLYLDSLKPCYVVEKDGVFSHGDTIKEAKDSLIYKISNRDTSMYENYTLDTEITFEDAIKMYRCITGACESGTRHFVENVLKDKKKKYKISEVIELTKGQYNNEVLADFFKVG